MDYQESTGDSTLGAASKDQVNLPLLTYCSIWDTMSKRFHGTTSLNLVLRYGTEWVYTRSSSHYLTKRAAIRTREITRIT